MPVEYTNSVGMKFVLIPPGEFLMGSTAAEIAAARKAARDINLHEGHIPSEGPQHQVVFTQPIYLGMHEVTQAQYEQIMQQNPAYFAESGQGREHVVGHDTADHPVESVSWYDATEFCTSLSNREELHPFYDRSGENVTMLAGNGYRLPTEAEWEFACRAGTTTKYSIGDEGEALPTIGWIKVNSGYRTHAVGELPANPWGLYDLYGNVCEWVQDQYLPDYYQQALPSDPTGPAEGKGRVYRGGGLWHHAESCRSAHRQYDPPDEQSYNQGFRVAISVDAVKQSINAQAETAIGTDEEVRSGKEEQGNREGVRKVL